MSVHGMALCAEQSGWGSGYMPWFAWVYVVFGQPQWVRTLHHLGMWYLLPFAFIQMYMVFRKDVMNGETVISNIVNAIWIWMPTPEAMAAAPLPKWRSVVA